MVESDQKLISDLRKEIDRLSKQLRFVEDSNQRLLQANKDLHRAALEAERVAREEFAKRLIMQDSIQVFTGLEWDWDTNQPKGPINDPGA